MAVPKTITKGHKIKLTTMDKELDRMEQELLLPDNEQQTEIAEAITRMKHNAPDIDFEWEKMERQMGGTRTCRRGIIMGLELPQPVCSAS